jgi:hypothetical protein
MRGLRRAWGADIQESPEKVLLFLNDYVQLGYPDVELRVPQINTVLPPELLNLCVEGILIDQAVKYVTHFFEREIFDKENGKHPVGM